MAYKFTDTTQEARNDNIYEPDSIYIYDLDKNLKELLPHLNILSADGRSNQSLKLNTAEISGDGDVFLNKKYTSITIVLKGKLIAENIEDYNNHIAAIYNYFQRNQFKFSFQDEKEAGWYRYGTVDEVEIEDGTLMPEVQISIYCSDPFKRKMLNEHKNLSEDEKYNDWLSYGIKEHSGLYQPKKLVINYNLASTVTSEGIKIDACDSDGNIVKSIRTLPYSEIREENTIEIKFKSDNGEYLLINGYPGTRIIDISSNIADFGVPENGYIVIRNSDAEAYAVCEVKNLG